MFIIYHSSRSHEKHANDKPRTTRSNALSRPLSHIEADIVLQRTASAPLATSSRPFGTISRPPGVIVVSNNNTSTAEALTGGREDVDEKYRNDPQMCTSYVNQIHEYLREAQVNRLRAATRGSFVFSSQHVICIGNIIFFL